MMQKRILVVDDNKVYLKALMSKLQSTLPLHHYDQAENASQVYELIQQNVYDLCIVDLILPDSHDATLIEHLINEKQKVIVITDFTDENIRKHLLSLDIIDYVVKSDTDGFGYLLTLLRRLDNNKEKHVLIVDDSAMARAKINEALSQHNLNVIEAKSGEEALAILNAFKKIDLVVTDHEMDKMDGLELTKQIRRLYHMEELPIIAVTGSSNETLIARYLKSEANDFIKKPYSKEELRCRVATSLSMKTMFQEIKTVALTDRLTSLYNRFHLYERGNYLVQMSKRDNQFFALAVFDIDHFKSINDTYGHMAGDHALIEFSAILKKAFRKTDIIARFGGEEFVVIMPNTPLDQASKVCNAIREKVAQSHIVIEEGARKINFTISIGVTTLEENDTFESILQRTDKLLYDAKETGRNKVVAQ